MLLTGTTFVMAAGLLASCGNKKAEEKVEAETPAAVEETVQIVTTPNPALTSNPYNAEFFANAANQSEVATDSTYAVTPTGLKYVVEQVGTGKQPTADNVVTVHYVGRLLDGTVFDSSVSRGEPTTFPLNRVIPGWTEGLQLMKEGGVTTFYIPSELAYGSQGAPGAIPPDSPLIFDVQLIQVN